MPPKCSYTTGLDTSALAAISSTRRASNPSRRRARGRRRGAARGAPAGHPDARPAFAGRRRGARRSASLVAPSAVTWPYALLGRHRGPLSCRPAASRSGLGQRTSVAQPACSNSADHPGAGVDLARAARRAARRSGRRGAGCARTRPWRGSPATRRCRSGRGTERPLAERVADRVDRPGDVVQQRDPDQRAPEERGDARPARTRSAARRAPPAAAGRPRPKREGRGDPRTMSRSFIRSGAYWRCGVCSTSNSQPMWA